MRFFISTGVPNMLAEYGFIFELFCLYYYGKTIPGEESFFSITICNISFVVGW